MTLAERDSKVLWHPYTQMQTRPAPLEIERAQGVWLYTSEGRRILDGISSWWVNTHGHSHPKLNEALAKQARELEHVIFANCTHRPAVELAERLVALLPAGLTRVFYSDNGSTAVEVAMKMAWQYWRNAGQPRRDTFVTLHGAYHGDTVGAMSASEDSLFTRAFDGMLFQVARADSPYCFRCPLGLRRETCSIDCLGSLERQLEELGDRAGGVLVEPMLQGAGGMIVWPREFLAGARRLCDRFGTLLIADEVLTGFGRTGRMFACEHAAVAPDIICLSKGLTAGYMALGATVATERIYQAFLSEDRGRTFFHGHSYTANPLACAVGVASLELFREEATLERIARLERQIADGFALFRGLPGVADVRAIGGVGVLELGGSGYLDAMGPQLSAAFLARGLLLRPLGNVLYFLPPYCITESETSWCLEQIGEVVEEVVGS